MYLLIDKLKEIETFIDEEHIHEKALHKRLNREMSQNRNMIIPKKFVDLLIHEAQLKNKFQLASEQDLFVDINAMANASQVQKNKDVINALLFSKLTQDEFRRTIENTILQLKSKIDPNEIIVNLEKALEKEVQSLNMKY